MFGHQDGQDNNQTDQTLSDTNAPLLQTDTSAMPEPPAMDPPQEPVTSDQPDLPLPEPADAPVITEPPVDQNQADTTPDLSASPTPTPSSDGNNLLDIKQQALQQLSPLMGHLNQTPEEKFRTTMMMIQAADDQSLIPTAYEAAQQITDEKGRAQALLDVVNEINYFTQQKAS